MPAHQGSGWERTPRSLPGPGRDQSAQRNRELAPSAVTQHPLTAARGRGRAPSTPSARGSSRDMVLRSDEVVVRVGPAVAVELPRLADLGDLVEVHVPDDQLLVMGRAQVADELSARIDEVALAVEVVVADVGLDADPVDRPD